MFLGGYQDFKNRQKENDQVTKPTQVHSIGTARWNTTDENTVTVLSSVIVRNSQHPCC